MNLFLKELKHYRVAFIAWILIIAGLMVVVMTMAPTMFQDAQRMKDFLSIYPPAMARAFSINIDMISNPLGIYVMYGTMIVMALGSVFSATVAGSILHKEQAGRTAEFLLTKPMSRLQIALIKIGAFVALAIGFSLLTTFTGWLSLEAFSPTSFSVPGLLVVSTYTLALILAIGGVSLLLSVVVKRGKSMTGPVIGIVLGFYFLDMVAKITSKYDALGWVSPFKWVDTAVTRVGYGFEWWRLGLFAALILVTVVASVLIYRRKDVLT
jgi:ABC-2 type transport system permease protein